MCVSDQLKKAHLLVSHILIGHIMRFYFYFLNLSDLLYGCQLYLLLVPSQASTTCTSTCVHAHIFEQSMGLKFVRMCFFSDK
ncbi:hypothetical protein E1A91_D08G072800v1 [Gossypium mustelinum]|uniref:Uncharacterized protein n=1 Tax=Gossypium mustelinum TaxID=34275 RepID=A0A5D2TU33_GOSMU|nr:hypothetical protein E1A91_D08G072800v1 [Gossypium mustelinum]